MCWCVLRRDGFMCLLFDVQFSREQARKDPDNYFNLRWILCQALHFFYSYQRFHCLFDYIRVLVLSPFVPANHTTLSCSVGWFLQKHNKWLFDCSQVTGFWYLALVLINAHFFTSFSMVLKWLNVQYVIHVVGLNYACV